MQELDFEANIAQGLAQWKSEDEIWGDITYAMRQVLKEMLEGLLEAERDRLVACSWYGRSPERRDERAGYRTRSIVTALGKISGLRVPRTRRARFQTRLWKRYKRRAAPIEVAVMESFVCGVATRKVKRALRSVLGNDGPSHQTVSRIVAGLNRSLKKWQRRPIDDDIEILYLDGVFLRIKERGIKKRPTLFAMGITTDGRMRILGFHHAWQESADEWHAFCQTLYERGLKGSALKLVVADQAGAIEKSHHSRCQGHLQGLLEGASNKENRAVPQEVGSRMPRGSKELHQKHRPDALILLNAKAHVDKSQNNQSTGEVLRGGETTNPDHGRLPR